MVKTEEEAARLHMVTRETHNMIQCQLHAAAASASVKQMKGSFPQGSLNKEVLGGSTCPWQNKACRKGPFAQAKALVSLLIAAITGRHQCSLRPRCFWDSLRCSPFAEAYLDVDSSILQVWARRDYVLHGKPLVTIPAVQLYVNL